MLDTIFEHHFGGDEIIEIESLQIDLGTLPESGFNNEFRRRLTDLLNLEFEKIAKNSHFTVFKFGAYIYNRFRFWSIFYTVDKSI